MKRPENIKRLRFLKKAQVFFLFFVFSSLFWLVVTLSATSKKAIKINISLENQVTNIDKSKDNHLVEVLVNTTGFKLLQLYLHPKIIKIDNHNLIQNVGNNLYILPNQQIQYFQKKMNNVKIERFLKDTLFFSHGRLHFKKVPVKSEVDIRVKLGYLMDSNPKLIPDSIVVFGALEDLKHINYVKTQPVLVEDLQTNFQKDLEIDSNFLEKFRVKTNIDKIALHIFVSKYTEEIMEIPIYMRNKSKLNVEIFPKIVKLRLIVHFDNREKIRYNQFYAEVEIPENQSKKITLLPVNIRLQPHYIHSFEMEPKYVNYIIRK